MNNFSASELKTFEKKLGSYHYLLTFRYSNLCVKADPMSLLPVTVTVGNMQRNIEEVAEVVQMDDFHLAVMPKRMDVIRDVQEGIFEAHPEFKISLEQMEEDQADSKFLLCEMPPVDKKRHDLLTEATKSLYEECKARMDAILLEEKKIFVELLAEEPESLKETVDQLNKKYSDAVSDIQELRDKKLDEIEEAYAKYLENHTQMEEEDQANVDVSHSMYLGDDEQ
jgi:ribosome recycling factor